MLFDYDDSSPFSILEYAQKMINRTFNDLLNDYNKSPYKSYEEAKNESLTAYADVAVPYEAKPAAKGELGSFIEKYYFGYKPNSDSNPDFIKAGVELKQTPIDILKSGKFSAGERLSITMISFQEPVTENFYKSHLWKKIQLILLIHYIRDKSVDRYDYVIKYVNLFTPTEEDLQIIREDYRKINDKIKAGKAHEISESDTLYLGASTKGSTAIKSQVPQYYGNHTLAKRRNFCFKRSYMDYILKQYVMKDKLDAEKIIKNVNSLKTQNFEDIIINKIAKYYNKSDKYLLSLFNIKQNKTSWATIIYRILGISGNKAEEFVKANIKIKAIRVEENGNVKEHMPLPTFRFKDIISQNWNESDLYKLLSETKFLFVMFYKNGENYYLKSSQFWNMNDFDLDIVKEEWLKVKNIISNGVEFYQQPNGNIKNNLLGSSKSQIIHVRPHASKSAYKLANGFTKGDLKFADELPDGQWMTKQSFWINKKYLIDSFLNQN